MSLDKLSRQDRQVGITAIVLLISALFFPWFSYNVGIGSATATATGYPDGWLGVLSVIVLIALIADLAIERFAPQVEIPPIGGGREATRLILAGTVAGLLALKFLFHISHFGWGFFVDAVATIALVYFALEARRIHD